MSIIYFIFYSINGASRQGAFVSDDGHLWRRPKSRRGPRTIETKRGAFLMRHSHCLLHCMGPFHLFTFRIPNSFFSSFFLFQTLPRIHIPSAPTTQKQTSQYWPCAIKGRRALHQQPNPFPRRQQQVVGPPEERSFSFQEQ